MPLISKVAQSPTSNHGLTAISLFIPLFLGMLLAKSQSARAETLPERAYLLPQTADVSATPTPCPLAWDVIPSPSRRDAGGSYLNAISASTPSDVWAVGGQNVEGNDNLFIEHWDGNTWSIVPGPQFQQSVLFGVTTLSPTDAWGVGTYDAVSFGPPLTVHWDGNTWSQVPSPNPGQGSVLQGIAAATADDIWAVGDYISWPDQGALIEHWDGVQWRVALTDSARSTLRAVDIVSANDVWAVGERPAANGNIHTLTMHWNGNQWGVVPSPNLGDLNHLNGIAAISTNDVWAVGQSSSALTLHWDGNTWSIVPVPRGLEEAVLRAVAARAANDVWAVGYAGIFPGIHTVALHWDGSQWVHAYTPNISPVEARLYGVAIDPDGNGWAVGNYSETRPRTLAERYRPGTCCPFYFTDVQTSDYFYEAVRHLYCSGAISGYADNTFRPYNDATRGQLAKIIVLSKGWPINTTNGPHFSDVPQDHPFYAYIETAYNHGVISGYSDGTFRPGNNITRAQLCKVIVTAQQWPIDTSNGPHFSDVPASNSFYGYIETAYSYGIISGYADGTFRWGNNATRGQISKIVYTAIVQP